MVKHVVCFKLKCRGDAEKAASVLLSMKGKVPFLRGLEVGVDFLGSPRSCDVILSVLLDDEQALADYQSDPYHCGTVKKYMHEVTISSVSADYIV